MFIEIIDALRCPIAHEDSWLVLATTRLENRHVLEGTLGCPVCRSEYGISQGIADLRVPSDTAAPHREHPSRLADAGDGPDAAGRLAALLGLGDPLGFAVLSGDWGRLAPTLLEVVECPALLLVDPPEGLEMGAGLSGVRCGAVLPMAAGATRAIALDTADGERAASAVQATRVGGRVVAPANVAVPDGLRELARDETLWVAEREAAASRPIALQVRRR